VTNSTGQASINRCGQVDEEISAPELVKAKNLCPHQDLIYFCEPTAQERVGLESFKLGVAALHHPRTESRLRWG
jgi:hypothetical protein